MSIYLVIVLAVLGFAILLPENPQNRKIYVILMAVIHAFICGFKYMYLSGDLRKYASSYYTLGQSSWSEMPTRNGYNLLWSVFQRFFSVVTQGDFQVFLIFLAAFTEVVLAILIYRYSACPWMSYLIWNCFSFYIYGFSAIKQGTAMTFLLIAMIAVLDDRPILFYFSVIIAGLIHFPAFIFLPVYAIRNVPVSERSFLAIAGIAIIIYLFREQIVSLMSTLYYDTDRYGGASNPGTKFVMMGLLTLAGVLLHGSRYRQASKLLHIMIIATVLQMFSGYGNIFSRLADYYFQFSILYVPLFFARPIDLKNLKHLEYYHSQNRFFNGIDAALWFTERSRTLTILLLVVFFVAFYYYTGFGHAGKVIAIDDIWTYRTMWNP